MNHPNSKYRPCRSFAGLLAVVGPLLVIGLVWPSAERSVAQRTPQEAVPAHGTPGDVTPHRAEYVSDRACAECHQELFDSYRRHSMGQSLGPVGKIHAVERFDNDARNPFEADGFRYEVRRDGDRTLHVETRLGADGRPVTRTAAEVQYAVGSGKTGRSYLVQRDGRLFLSPITWYARKQRWDLSPGFETNNSHFNRPVIASCLYCHANRARPVEDSLNRYHEPVFEGHAIGCQRCHGPGSLHVALQKRGEPLDGPDNSIIHPARLNPQLRDAVCQQCHLSGQFQVVRRGRQRQDYRPGLPWEDFVAVFVSAASAGDREKFVGHVEQMHASRCFQQSEGKLACISCHDPHSLPAADQRIAFYRQRCMECHRSDDCGVAAEVRRETSRQDSCIACHMPRVGTEIRHAATTDHRIPRSAGARRTQREPGAGRVNKNNDGDVPLVSFFQSAMPGSVDADAERDLGIATVMALDQQPELIADRHVRGAVQSLEAAVKKDPGDLPALESLGRARGHMAQLERSLADFEAVLAMAPQREFALTNAASSAMALGQLDKAQRYWQRAVELNPWMVRYRAELALVYAMRRQWPQCRQTCIETLRRFPNSFRARQYLIESHLALGQPREAQREFDRWIECNPPNQDRIHDWYKNHPLRRPK